MAYERKDPSGLYSVALCSVGIGVDKRTTELILSAIEITKEQKGKNTMKDMMEIVHDINDYFKEEDNG